MKIAFLTGVVLGIAGTVYTVKKFNPKCKSKKLSGRLKNAIVEVLD